MNICKIKLYLSQKQTVIVMHIRILLSYFNFNIMANKYFRFNIQLHVIFTILL